MKSSSRVDTPRYQSQMGNDNEWEQQIKSEQLYNAFCRSSQKVKSNGGSFITDRTSDVGFKFIQGKIETVPDESFFNQSQGPAVNRPNMRQQHSNFAVTATNSMVTKQNMTGDYQQYPETMSVSSQSSLDEPYSSKIDLMDEKYKLFHQKSAQLEKENISRSTSVHKKSRKQMQEEIKQLKFELLACRESLNLANQKNEVLQMLLNQQKNDAHLKDNKGTKANSKQEKNAEVEQCQDKPLEVDVKSVMETETDSNIAVPEQAKTPSALHSEPISDLKTEEPKTSMTEGKPMPLITFEEEKEPEQLVMVQEQVEEEVKKM